MTGNDPNKDKDPFDDLEERFSKNQEAEGYKEGFEIGRRDGQRDGERLGLEEGAERGSELGYFNGYTRTYKELISALQHQPSSAKPMKLLDDILKLIDEFPTTNEPNCEEKLTSIRLKFRQAFLSKTDHFG